MFGRLFKPMRLVDAILAGKINHVHYHLKAGVNPNERIPSERGYPLHFASHSYSNIIGLLIEYGADVNVRDEGGKTPLHIAAGALYLEGVRVLLKNGANVNAVDKEGNTPLRIATQGTPLTALFAALGMPPEENEMRDRKAVAELLIAHGAVMEEVVPTPEEVMQKTGMSEDELTRRFLEHLIQSGKNPFKGLPEQFRRECEQKYPDLLDLARRKLGTDR